MTSNDSLALPQALGDVGEHIVNAELDANGPAQQLQRLPDGETLSRWIPVSNSRGSRPMAPLTPSGDRQVSVGNINSNNILQPARPVRRARGGRTGTRSSLRVRTRERQRLRINQSSPSRESSSQLSESDQLPSTSVNLVMEENMEINHSNETQQPTTHDIMYRP